LNDEPRVRFHTNDKWNGKTGTLIGQERAGCAAIPDGTHQVLTFDHGEFEILPDDPDPTVFGETNPQPT